MPDYFHYKNQQLYAEQVNLADVAKQYGTPCYVYSRAALENNWHRLDRAFGDINHRICYAVKANPNIAILNLFARLNSGFDIVSVGELERVLVANGDPKKVVFSGVAKQLHEIERAIDVGVGCFNVESIAELEFLQTIAEKKQTTIRIALRINPNIDVRTHPYIATGLNENKFGILFADAMKLLQTITSMPNIKLIGVACHIGSQLMDLEPFVAACERLVQMVAACEAHGIQLEHVNIGGGLGVQYHDEIPPSITDYVTMICHQLASLQLEIVLEPGRSLVADAGILLTRIIYLKHTEHKNFAITDAGMNDLLRPALYHAWHDIIPVSTRDDVKVNYDIVGPVCESADFIGKNREMSLEQDDLLAVLTVGAYGSSMSSNYNTRPKAVELMVDGEMIYCIRHREEISELYKNEKIIAS